MSAYANLAGLYPPTGKDVWDQVMPWQPIPVHTERERHDKLLAMKKACPAYNNMVRQLKESEDYQNFNAKYKEVYEYLSVNSGRSINDLDGAGFLYSCLHIEETTTKVLPDWTKQVYPEPLASLSARSFAIPTFTRQMARLKAGPLLRDILERFQNKSDGTLSHDRVMMIYSGHDTTVASLLNILRVFQWHNPPFAACVMLELRLLNDVPYVSVVYKNETEPVILTIPGCGVTCPLQKMFKLYADVLPKNWDAECQATAFYAALVTKVGSDFNLTVILVVISLIVLSSSLIAYGVWKKLYNGRGSRLYTEIR